MLTPNIRIIDMTMFMLHTISDTSIPSGKKKKENIEL